MANVFADIEVKASRKPNPFALIEQRRRVSSEENVGGYEFRQAEEDGLFTRVARTIRESLSPLVGPTERERLEGSVVLDGEVQYKPLASGVDREGFIPAMFAPNAPWELPTAQADADAGAVEQVATGAYNVAANVVNTVTSSPGGLLSLGLFSPISAARNITGAGGSGATTAIVGSEAAFTADMVRGIAEAAPQTIDTLTSDDASLQSKTEAGLGALVGTFFSALAGRGVYKNIKAESMRGKAPREVLEEVSKETGKPVEEVIRDAEVAQESTRAGVESQVDTETAPKPPEPVLGDAVDTEAPTVKNLKPEEKPVRGYAEKIIEDPNYTEAAREALANDPRILYEQMPLKLLGEDLKRATPEQLDQLAQSGDVFRQVGALVEKANRAFMAGDDALGADLSAQVSTRFTEPAQLLNVARLSRDPRVQVEITDKALNKMGRKLADEQRKTLLELSREEIKTRVAMEEAANKARENFSVENEAYYKKALDESGAAKKKLADYTRDLTPQGVSDIVVKAIQGNLLTPMSIMANVIGNIAYQPIRRASRSMASIVDLIQSKTAGTPRALSATNPLPSAREMKAALVGVRIAAAEMVTGPTAGSYIKGEVQHGFRPIRSLIQAISKDGMAVAPDGTVKLGDRAKKLTEFLIGAPPEVMFRLLNLGDKPFRRAAEVEILLDEARIRGLKGRDLEQFLALPDETAMARVDSEARRSIFAQDNRGIKLLNSFLDEGAAKVLHLDRIPALAGALKILGRVVVPYRQFPLNFVMSALGFALPEFGIAKAVYQSADSVKRNRLADKTSNPFEKNKLKQEALASRRNASISLAEAVLGVTMYAVTDWLWDNGLISEPSSADAKDRTVQQQGMGAARLNLSGMERLAAGGDPKYQTGDTLIDWTKIGIPAAVFHVRTLQHAQDRSAKAKVGAPAGRKDLSSAALDRIGAFPGVVDFAFEQSFLAGTASFLDALKEVGNPDSRAMETWMANAFRAVSTVAVPNTVEALARAEYRYVPELRGEKTWMKMPVETFKNIWDYKTFQLPKDERAIVKRDVWGEPIERTPGDANPYAYNLIDVFKTTRGEEDPFKQKLFDLFDRTGLPDVYPNLPSQTIQQNGVYVRLSPDDYENLQGIVGKMRKRVVEPVVLSEQFDGIEDMQKILLLESLYSKVGSAAQDAFAIQPEIQNRYFGEGADQSRVRSKTTKAKAMDELLSER